MTELARRRRGRSESRNSTEDAILAAARDAITEEPYERVTIDGIARRAFVSRTTVYFYFPNKRAVVDRLIQRVFSDMYEAARPYVEGDGDPRVELRRALARTVAVVNRDESVLKIAFVLSGGEDHLPQQWAPYIQKLVDAASQRIARDQQSGRAPGDIPARDAAQALMSMVERHVTLEILNGGRAWPRLDPGALGAVVARRVLAPGGAAQRLDDPRERRGRRSRYALRLRGFERLASRSGCRVTALRRRSRGVVGPVRQSLTTSSPLPSTVAAGGAPSAWKPPSTWTISPVMPRARSDSSQSTVSATGREVARCPSRAAPGVPRRRRASGTPECCRRPWS